MRAYLKNYRQSPRKVRLVADTVRGKSVPYALTLLDFVPKRASVMMKKLIRSAAANAQHNDQMSPNTLYVKTIMVDEGPTMKRFRPRARGMASRIRKRTSNITLELGDKSEQS